MSAAGAGAGGDPKASEFRGHSPRISNLYNVQNTFRLMEARLFSVPVPAQRAGLLVLALGCSALAVNAQPAKNTATVPQTVYIKAGHLFDATSDKLRDNVVLVVEGERISKIAPAAEVSIPTGAMVVDLSKDWVLPGLIDCHTHLEARSDHYDPIWDVKETPFDGGFNGVLNANKTLMAGFTGVRDVGSQPFFAVDLRKAIDAGDFPGPRVVASGPPISITGGHGDMNGFAPGVENLMYPAERDYQLADGPEAVRHAVREQVKYGVDVIKILATGGVLSQGDKPGAEQMTYEEMKMAVDTAHAAGRKVAAHAHGTQGIKDAVRAGVDSIEHGSLIDAEGIELMKAARGVPGGGYLQRRLHPWEKLLSSDCLRRTSTRKRWWAGCNARTLPRRLQRV